MCRTHVAHTSRVCENGNCYTRNAEQMRYYLRDSIINTFYVNVEPQGQNHQTELLEN